MKNSKIAMLLIGLFITGPIWYYLLYKILQAVNAGELMWFLYWIYVPAAIILNIIAKTTDDN